MLRMRWSWRQWWRTAAVERIATAVAPAEWVERTGGIDGVGTLWRGRAREWTQELGSSCSLTPDPAAESSDSAEEREQEGITLPAALVS